MNASTLRGLAVLALLCLLPRASALTINYLSDERAITQTGAVNNLLTPVAPFADFTGSLFAGGVSVSQTSALGTGSMTASGTFSGNQVARNPDQLATSLFKLTFRLDEWSGYDLTGYRLVQGLFGLVEITLTGPSGTLINWSGGTPPNDYFAQGVLAPGIYTLKAVEQVGVTSAPFNDATFGRYSVAMAIRPGVPDAGSTAALLLTALVGLIIFHRRWLLRTR